MQNEKASSCQSKMNSKKKKHKGANKQKGQAKQSDHSRKIPSAQNEKS